jgi:hypothetical protein
MTAPGAYFTPAVKHRNRGEAKRRGPADIMNKELSKNNINELMRKYYIIPFIKWSEFSNFNRSEIII